MKLKYSLIFFSMLLSGSLMAQEQHDHLEEWNNLSEEERKERETNALHQVLDPKFIAFLNNNNIPITEYQSIPAWVDDNGNYSLTNPNQSLNERDQIQKDFFDTFNGARLFYNTEHELVSVCANSTLNNCSNRPFRNSSGDFYIRDFNHTGNRSYFEIEVDRNRFYVDGLTLLSNFDIFTFYELPSRFKSGFSEQFYHSLNGLTNHSYTINLEMFYSCTNEDGNLLSMNMCDPTNSEKLKRGGIFTINNANEEYVFVSHNNSRYIIDVDEFYRANIRKVIIRKTY